ncbi:GNAT family N-acetyltransferase [Streptomyces sp. NRRL F-5630]|uniref:GNAT family N-acetyltransferase n=1 Tax=unclassified Streptomyces TaxID=2593676 RepID=UPI0004CA5AE0|nr:GNAT family N-acetyltransferase [Streptomyces sp. NRRL F-5630]
MGGTWTDNVFPETELVSGNLRLRAFGAGDVEDVRLACSDEEILRWLPLPRPYGLEAARSWCTDFSHHLRTSGEGIHWAVTSRESGRFLGAIGLNSTRWTGLVSEVGYWVAPWTRRQGVAVAATRTVAGWLLGECGFERLELRAATGNLASQAVAERAGFVREGVLRNAGHVYEGRVDLVGYSLIPADRVALPKVEARTVAD